MKKHFSYIRYIFLHKLYVFLECVNLGIPLAGIIHDWSKLLPDEWFPYAQSFYGPQPRTRTTKDSFNLAWLKHQHRSPHHWQYWILRDDDGDTKIIEMTDRYRREMLADWRGAGRAQGFTDTLSWYRKNREKIIIGPETREWIEKTLCVYPEYYDTVLRNRAEPNLSKLQK